MPTRQGWTVAGGALAALVIGRVFGIVELFVVGAGLGFAVVLAVLAVRLRRPNLAIGRWIHPAVLTVGDTGRVDLLIENRGRRRSPPADLTEPVGAHSTAQMAIAAAPRRRPCHRRLSRPGRASRRAARRPHDAAPARPARARRRHPARRRRDRDHGRTSDLRAADAVARAVACSAGTCSRSRNGSGPASSTACATTSTVTICDRSTGRHRPRSEELKVRQHEAQGVRRCIIVLDRDGDAYPAPVSLAEADVFERAIVAAAQPRAERRPGRPHHPLRHRRGRPPRARRRRPRAAGAVADPARPVARRARARSRRRSRTRSSSSPARPPPTRGGAPSGSPIRRSPVSACSPHPERRDGRLAVDASTLTAFRVGWNRIAGGRGLAVTDAPADRR